MIAARPAAWLRHAVSCSLALCSIGCRDVLGPEKMRVVTVEGKVTQGNKKVTRGWIEFVPVDGTVGRMRSARVLEDGTFHATKVAVGVILIRLVNADIDDSDLRRVFGSFASPIRRTITDEPGGRVEIDVFAEYRKAAASKTQEGGRAAEPRPSR